MPHRKKSNSSLHKGSHRHFIVNILISLLVTSIALFIGMYGYHVLEQMTWIDSFMNASMILSGMGPASTLITTDGKLFAGCYALFSGLVFIAILVMILSPLIHKIFRKIHLENSNDNN